MKEMVINEIVDELEKQLSWRGPSGQVQGIMTMSRKDAMWLNDWIRKAIRLCESHSKEG